MKGQLVLPKSSLNFGFASEPKKRIRKPIKSKIRKQLTVQRKKCKWCRKNPIYEIHHIDGNRSNGSIRNLIGLCANCHRRAGYGEITKEQLRKRLGIKPTKRVKSRSHKHKTNKPYYPLEAIGKSMRKETERQNRIIRKYF